MGYLDSFLYPTGFPRMSGVGSPANPREPNRNAWDQQVMGNDEAQVVSGPYAAALNPARVYQRMAQAFTRGAPASTRNAVTAANGDPNGGVADNTGGQVQMQAYPRMASVGDAAAAQAEQSGISGRMEDARQNVNYATMGSGFLLRDAMQNGGRSTPGTTFNSDYGYGDVVTARAGADGRINQFSGVGGGGSGRPNPADYEAAMARAAADRARLAPEPIAQAALPSMSTPDSTHPLDADISRLSRSDGIVDQWRMRRLARVRDADMGQRSAALNASSAQTAAQASAMRAGNEVPLAQMQDLTLRRNADLRYGSDLRSDATTRRGQDMTSADREATNRVIARGQNAQFAPHAGQADIDAQIAKLVTLGTPEALERVREIRDATARQPTPQDRAAKTITGMDGTLHTYSADGKLLSSLTVQEQQAQAKKRQQEAAAETVKRGWPTLGP